MHRYPSHIFINSISIIKQYLKMRIKWFFFNLTLNICDNKITVSVLIHYERKLNQSVSNFAKLVKQFNQLIYLQS